MNKLKRSEREIEELRGDLNEILAGDKYEPYPGMSYSEGVDACLRWLMGDEDDHPVRT